jgi:esterase/lipase
MPVIIYVHGFNGMKDWGNFDLIAHQFKDAGFFFIKMNLSHNGTSLQFPLEFNDTEAFGNNNYSKELFDIEQILDWVCNEENSYKKYLDINRIVLIGHSRGGGISILKAAEDFRVKALITWASISECNTSWKNMNAEKMETWKKEGVIFYSNKRTNQKLPLYYQLYEDYMNNESRFNIKNAISKLKIPILVCHGTIDSAVPYSNAVELVKYQPSAQLFSIESDHVFGRSHPWHHDFLPDAMQKVVNVSIEFLEGEIC